MGIRQKEVKCLSPYSHAFWELVLLNREALCSLFLSILLDCCLLNFVPALRASFTALSTAQSTRQVMVWNLIIYTTFNSCLILFWFLCKPQVISLPPLNTKLNSLRKWPAPTTSSHVSRSPEWTSSTPACQLEGQCSRQISLVSNIPIKIYS